MTSSNNKYASRRSIVTENRIRELEAFGGGNPIPHEDYRIMLEDMVQMSLRRHGRPLPMLKLQGEMLQDLVDAEGSVSIYKKKLAELESSNAPAEDIAFVKSELSKYRRLKYALRDIGDGIAWRFLSFDRCALTQIGIYPRKQHIHKEGLTSEMHELGDVINKHNKVAILNDITNILKKGDITAELTDGSFEFVEVKSSNVNSPRLIRQKNNLLETISFLNEGEKTKDGKLFRILSLPVDPQSYMSAFERLLLRAEKECMLVKTIGDHLVLHVTDFRATNRDIEPEPYLKKLDEVLNSWQVNGDFFIESDNIDRYSHVQNFAPFSVFPIQHKLRVKLMTGTVLVRTFLNVSSVLRYLSIRGWTVLKGPWEFAKEAESATSKEGIVAVLKKGPMTIHLPLPIIGRLGQEYLSVKTLGEIFDNTLKAGPISADGFFFNLDGEAKQWD